MGRAANDASGVHPEAYRVVRRILAATQELAEEADRTIRQYYASSNRRRSPMPCLAYRRAAVSNAGSPVKPATDASHACGDSRFSTAEWGKFAVDSPLEQSGFELSVPPACHAPGSHRFVADSALERRRFELAVPPRSRARLAGRAGRFPAGRARPTLAMDVECPPHLSLSRTVGPLADQHPNCQVGLTRYRRTGTG